MKIIGIDVGGTFTDFHLQDLETGTAEIVKLPSTPDNPAEAILAGLRRIVREGLAMPSQIRRICHGTTVATNALIQRRGGPAALVTTEGFQDVLEIGRQTRPHMYDPRVDHPAPLVERRLRLTAAERIDAKGRVVRALGDEEIDRIVARLQEEKVAAVAICFLFSFLNPEHERRLGRALSAAGFATSLSCEVQPEFREYERMSTTVLNAYLIPVMTRYLERLEEGLAEDFGRIAVGINQSSGGLMSLRQARRFPVRTALSGPAAGAVGAAHVARLAGISHVITLDMGGTSADVCLIESEEPRIAYDRSIGGFPVRLPMVDVNAVGAGGGSIVWFDAGGMLKVGPLSAGAKPGPACYGRGGREPTVTDANLILGRLNPAGLLGGTMPLDIELARSAFRPVAERLGMPIERAALGCIDIVVSNMVRAIRSVSVERGYDPREFTLMPFGGAGPLHAEDVAEALDIRTILVPPHPGILCAQGLIVSDLKESLVRTDRAPLIAASLPRMRAVVSELLSEAEAWFAAEGIDERDRRVELSLDLRYFGQNYELSVPVGSDLLRHGLDGRAVDAIAAAFHAVHEQAYGYHDDAAMIETVNYRCVARARQYQADNGALRPKAVEMPQPIEIRPVWFGPEHPTATPIFRRDGLLPGHRIVGPAIIEQLDSTTLVRPGTEVAVDDRLNLILTRTR